MKKSYREYKTLLIVLLILNASCSKKESSQLQLENSEPEKENVVSLTDEQFKSLNIQFGKIEERSLGNSVSVTGKLDVPPQNVMNITAPFGGFLRSTTMLQGMHVSRGQIVAVVENPEYIQLQQDFLDSKSQAEYLASENERQEELAKENVNSLKALQKSRAELASMQAKNNGLKAKLKMLNIDADKLIPGAIRSTIELHSPINGYITQVNKAIGDFVNPTEVMFQIVDTEHLHAELTAFERDIPKIKIGQKIHFILANETTERMATVFLIGREISNERTVRIHGHLDNEDSNLIPGMYLKASIETGSRAVPSLPDAAIVTYGDKNYIFLPDAGNSDRFKMVPVSSGLKENGFTEIQLPDGFDLQTPVVVKGTFYLLSKLKNGAQEE